MKMKQETVYIRVAVEIEYDTPQARSHAIRAACEPRFRSVQSSQGYTMRLGFQPAVLIKDGKEPKGT